MLKFFDAVCKTAVISSVTLSFTPKKCWDVQHELPQHHIKFHPDQLISGRMNTTRYIDPQDTYKDKKNYHCITKAPHLTCASHLFLSVVLRRLGEVMLHVKKFYDDKNYLNQ